MVTSLVGMVFTPACALALKVANAPRAAAASAGQGPVSEGLVAIDLPADVHAGTAKSALWYSPTPNMSRAQGVGQLGVADGVGQPLPRLDLARSMTAVAPRFLSSSASASVPEVPATVAEAVSCTTWTPTPPVAPTLKSEEPNLR